MNRWQDRLMGLIRVLGFIGTSDMLRGIIAADIEKQLGRKLTDWEWQVFWEESIRKAAVEESQRTYQEWLARTQARRVIRNFVWNGT